MWKPSQTGPTSLTPEPESLSPAALPTPAVSRRVPTAEQSSIGKGLFIKGEIAGSESLFVDGKVEGAINIPESRVTVGINGQVAANVTAREVVILGKVRGNVSATDRVRADRAQ